MPVSAVIALFAGDKARMGDIFYDSVGTRADAAIESWIRKAQQRSTLNALQGSLKSATKCARPTAPTK